MGFALIRKRDFFIKATLVCKENGNCLTYKNKKDLTKCKVFLNAPPYWRKLQI